MNTNYEEAGKNNNSLKRKGGIKDEFSARPYETRMIAHRMEIGMTDCGCNADWTSGIVLDPFSGSGTTLEVARILGRQYIGIELSAEYIKLAEQRLAQNKLL